MTATASPTELGYWINDADNHFNEPPDCFERYIDPKYADAGHSQRDRPRRQADAAVRRSALQIPLPPGHLLRRRAPETARRHHQRRHSGAATCPKRPGRPELDVIPGMLLNRLNPLKGMDDDQRKAFISEFRHKSEAFGNRDLRLPSWTNRASKRP